MSHSPVFRLSRRAAVLALTLFASLLSCGREITGPGGRGPLVQLAFTPDYSSMIDEVGGMMHSVAELLPFTKVRLELRRVDNSIAASRTIDFPANATQVPLTVSVRLGAAATRTGEALTAYLRYINAAGDTVYAGGPVAVTALLGATPTPVEIPVVPVAPGAVFARLEISPDSIEAVMGQNIVLTAVGYDAQENVVPNAIIGFISRNPTLASVANLGSGTVFLNGVRGSTWVVAQSLTGLKDSTFVHVLPRPSLIEKVSGDAQVTLTDAAFPQPLRVRLRAADGLPVANWRVNFAVTAGQGLLSAAADTTDASGEAEVVWTAGATVGPASVTVSVPAPALTPVVFTGTQATTLPQSLVFETQPTNITAGDTLPTIQVSVRNGLNQVITTFGGEVTLGLSGPAGAALIGTSTANAVNGVATFSGLTVNKGGTGYALSASHAALFPATSATFTVTAAPASTITVLGGDGQSVPPSTELPDSIRVRITDQFTFPVAGAAVQFTVTQGGGTVTAASVLTDADGRAAVKWTAGASGAQQLRVHLGALEQFVSATVVAAAEVRLFAGYDYTLASLGNSKLIPIYLTNPSASPVTLTLSVPPAGTGIIAWSSPTAVFNPGQTRIDVPVQGLGEGSAWAVISSASGDDSVFVTVEPAFLELTSLNDYFAIEGDTIRTFVKLSEPAPAGGTTVVIRSADAGALLLAPSSGAGTPNEGCVGALCFGGGSIAGLQETSVSPTTGTPGRLLATPADTAAVFIPAGQIVGEFAILVIDDLGGSANTQVTAEAPGYVGSIITVGASGQSLTLNYVGGYNPANGIGVGQQAPLEFYLGVRRARESRIYLESSDTLIAQVDSVLVVPAGTTYVPPTTIRIVGPDTAWIRISADGMPVDSLYVVGSAPAARVYLTTSPEGGEETMSLYVSSELNPFASFARHTDLVFTVTSGDPAVVVPAQPTATLRAGDSYVELPLRGVATGSTFIVVSAPGHRPDTVFAGTYTPGVQFTNYSPTLGVGQVMEHYLYLTLAAVRSGTRSISVQSLSPALLEVVTPTVQLSESSGGGTLVRLRGLAPGAALVRFSGPGISTTDLSVTVAPTTLQLFVTSNLRADGAEHPVTSAISVLGFAHPLADTTSLVLRSSNPAVVEVSDSIVVFPAMEQAYSYSGQIRPLAPGNATLWLVRTGVDSVSAATTVLPYQIIVQSGSIEVGQQLQTQFSVYRDGPDTLALPITITQAGAGAVSFPGSPQFDIGEYSSVLTMVGESPGVDTLTFTVDGYAPVTKIVQVDSSKALFFLDGGDAYASSVYPYVYNTFSTSGSSSSFVPGKPLRFRVVSLDTMRVAAVQDTIEWTPGDGYLPSRFATLRFKQPGNVQLTIEDLDGVMASDTVTIYVQPSDLYGSSWFGGGQALSIGMRQRTVDGELYIQRGMISTDPLWVKLESSNPSLVQVPDSILIGADELDASFIVTAGDTTGSARITASAPGYNPWVIDVIVTRAKFEMYAGDTFLDGGGWIEVYAVDALTTVSRPMTYTVDARFATSTPALIDATSVPPFTLVAGSDYAVVRGPTGLVAGNGVLRVEDNGVARFDSVAAGSERTLVRPATVSSNFRRVQLTPGLASVSSSLSAQVFSGRDTVVVNLASLNGLFDPLPDSLVIALDGFSSFSEYVPLRGLAPGRDTLTLAMAGARTDTVIVDIEDGALAVQGSLGQSIVVGDSLLVTLKLLDAAGLIGLAAADITFTASVSDTTFVVVDGGTTVSEVTAPGGQYQFSFWVRAESAGAATLTLTHPNFRPFTIRLDTAVRP